MILTDIAKVIRDEDIPMILNAAMEILERTGVQVENHELLRVFADNGALVDIKNQRVRFPQKMVENVIESSQKVPWDVIRPNVTAFAGVYQGYFLDPTDGQYKVWTQERLLQYANLAQTLPNINSISILGYPAASLNDARQPLLEKWFCWKYGIGGGSAIWTTELCPLIHEMWEIYADWQKKDIRLLFNGTVYLISPLRFAKEEAAQFVYFYKKGIRVHVGCLGTLGVTAPVTMDGALALSFAEGLFINLLNRICFNDNVLRFGCSISVMDMRTGHFQYGRPEQAALNIAGAQVAKAIDAAFDGHMGLSDAKAPGYESAGQKVYSALAGAMAYGRGIIEAGLLSVDEVFSPIQMILDDEMTGAVQKMLADIPVSPESLAVGVVDEVSPGGTFIDHEHTLINFKNSLWFPSLWSRESYSAWKNGGAEKNEINRAAEKYEALNAQKIAPIMPEDVEQKLLKVIRKDASEAINFY